jgi:hypothetical protein
MANEEKTRQEVAYDYISEHLIKLLQKDDRIAYEHKRSVISFWQDLFEHEGVKNNLLMAISDYLFEVDVKLQAARQAGIVQILDAIRLERGNLTEGTEAFGALGAVLKLGEEILVEEKKPEEMIQDIENTDLSEVGGGDEDDTSPL